MIRKVFKSFTVMSIIIVLFGCSRVKTEEHSFESSWSFDEYSHWHACIDAGYQNVKKDKAEHTYSEWIIDEEPTASKQGKKHKQCDVCGHRLVEEIIDIIPDEVDDDSNLIFTQLDSGNYSVKAASRSVEKIVIPNSYNCKPVTSIGSYAFEDCESLISIEIPDSVTYIGFGAFYNCTALTSIIIPDSVTCIYNVAFYGCKSLTSITIPNNVTYVGNDAFAYCKSLTSVTIPNSFTSIESLVFSHCKSLTSITIPDSVTSIGGGAFDYCTSLTSISIPDSVTSIGYGAFEVCSSLTSIEIPNSVTSIDGAAFADCSSLTSIKIPNGVTSIGRYTFRNCSSLTSIEIPTSVTYIHGAAFENCTSLQTINFDGTTAQWNAIRKGEGWNDEAPTSMVINCIGDYLLFTQLDSGNYSVKAASKSVEKVIVIPSTYRGKPVTMIENDAFGYCASITSISIPDSVISIGNYAFGFCTSLASINIPNSVTSIGTWTFGFCTSLTSITLPDNIISIGDYAFRDCSSLTSINIPGSVTSIGDYAFRGCSSLQTINFNGTKEQWNAINKGKNWNDEAPTNMKINCVDDYLSFTQLDSDNYSVKAASKSVEKVVIPSTYNDKPIMMIEDDAFRNCTSLTNIEIHNGVTSIGDYAFCDCYSLASIAIPNSITSIGHYAFYDCAALTSITIPNSVTSIGEYTFAYCSSLQTINFEGTKKQWNATINKGFYWNESVPTTLVIHCTDGDINL